MTQNATLLLKDEELVRLYVATQKQSYFEPLYVRYQPKIYRHCLQLIKDADLAYDFTQDIFIRVLSKLDQFQHRCSFSTWLYSLTRNYCISQLRVVKPTRFYPLEDGELVAEEPEESPELAYKMLQIAIRRLPAEEVSLLRMKYQHNWETAQIGLQMNLSEGAVKMRLKRSRDKLRKELDMLPAFESTYIY